VLIRKAPPFAPCRSRELHDYFKNERESSQGVHSRGSLLLVVVHLPSQSQVEELYPRKYTTRPVIIEHFTRLVGSSFLKLQADKASFFFYLTGGWLKGLFNFDCTSISWGFGVASTCDSAGYLFTGSLEITMLFIF
jgi:hypothetical protein